MFRRTKRRPELWLNLATYNAEVARGIRHTKVWREQMAQEQARFDVLQKEWLDKRSSM